MTRTNPTSRERLLRAALDEFAEHGRAGARTDRIARRAGVNKQLLHYYFRTKAGLYDAALAQAGQEVAESLTRIPLVGLTAVERLRRLLRAQFEFLSARSELTRLLIQAEANTEWADTAIGPLVALLTEGQATGFFRDDIDPRQHARQALILHLGYFAIHPLTRTWGDPAHWRDRMAELIVRGCTW